MNSFINESEVNKFSSIASEWWDYNGKFKPLHQFNPVRISYIRKKIIEHYNLNKESISPFSNLEIIDIGCGGGLVCEPFANMGAIVTGIDPSLENINVAKLHSKKSNLNINYQVMKENILDSFEGKKFDVVFALEVIEHVDNIEYFVESCANLTKENGLVFIATINRTIKSLLTAKFIAEYVLKWLPIGTHDWKKFLKPSEINDWARKNNLSLKSLDGFCYKPFATDCWQESKNIDVNYILSFQKI